MYSVVLLAALTATEKAPAHGWRKTHGYGVCYGTCYGVGYEGWPHSAGGWGLPYGGYWAGHGHGYGHHPGFPGALPAPMIPTPPSTYAPIDAKPGEKDKEKIDEKEKKKDKSDPDDSQVRARVIFELPKGAALFVDDTLIEKADERKSFRTPILRKGENYYYELRVELLRDGKKLVETKRVTVTAGDVIRTDFSSMGATQGVATVEALR